MSEAAPSVATESISTEGVAPARCQVQLDVLRGLAVLGILVMNIQAFSMPMATYVNPTVWGDLTGLNYAVWLGSHLLADQKFMALFSVLFGAGIVLFAERAEAKGHSATALHYRRLFWLLLFGLAHAYLLWFGDILVLYAVCGAVVFWARRWSVVSLMTAGLLLLSVSSLIYLFFGLSLPHWPAAQVAAMIDESWQPTAEVLARELAAYRGGWLEQMALRVPTAIEFQTFLLLIWGFWRAAGLMLIGMALYKSGILGGTRPTGIYLAFIAAALLIGLPLVAYGVYWNTASEWGLSSMFLGSQFNYWGSVLVMLGWIGVLTLVYQSGAMSWLTARLAAVGRMAFTNYLMQTVICVFLFYGHGLGWFGDLERSGQILVVFAIWALQLWYSPLWLSRFRQGPLEWLWRRLTYGRRVER
ncbi:MAG: DUF418 domain-containing protein [Gammaproteobacteria bacterium]|nr:DUF418 domain-containing protein [Gammaproteobacteria bacterium]